MFKVNKQFATNLFVYLLGFLADFWNTLETMNAFVMQNYKIIENEKGSVVPY
jgi:hypothetical protein